MASGRIYTIPFTRISITATQDLWNVTATASMAFELHSINLGAEGAVSAEELSVQFKRMTATVTPGTSGAAVTPVPALSTNTAATITCRCNDTGRATTSGSTTALFSDTWQLANGYIYQWAPEDRPFFSLSQNLLIGLETAPSGAHVCSGVITVAELL